MFRRKSSKKFFLLSVALILILVQLVSACAPTPAATEEAVGAEPAQEEAAEAEPVEEEAAEAEPTKSADDLPVEGEIPPPQAIVDYTAGVTAADKQYGGVTINIMVDAILTGKAFEWYEEALQKKFDININLVPVGFPNLYSSMQNDLIAGTGAYDIFVYPPRYNGDLAAAGSILVLDDYIKQWGISEDDLIPAFNDLYAKWNGKYVTLIYDGDVLQLYYRTDLFENAEEMAAFEDKYGYPLAPPKTWDQYKDVAEFFTRAAGDSLAGETLTDPFYGTAEILRAPDNFNWFLDRFASAGGVYFDEEMNPQIASDAGVKALEDFKEIVQYGPPDHLNFAYVETFSTFLQGTSAMVIQWSDIARSAEDPASSKVVGKVGYAMIPGYEVDGVVNSRPNLAYSRVMAISKLSKNPEAAYRVMQFINDPEVSLPYVTSPVGGIDPFRYSHFEDPSTWVMSWPTIDDFIANSEASLANGFPELTMPGAVRYDDALALHVAAALAGQEEPKAALEACAEEWDEITDELGRDQQITYWKAELDNWRSLGLAK